MAVEIKRAKTLWPVALRSLEARLDDVAPPRPRDDETLSTPESPPEDEHEDDSDDLLADLRDSLQAMENVAAQLERSQDDWAGDTTPHTKDTQQAIAGGARVVPLRAADP